MAEVKYGSLPFEEQIRFFLGKKIIPTRRWADVWQDGHDTGFMVAGAMKLDLLSDLHAAVGRVTGEGATLTDFRRDFDAIVKRHGWTGWRGSDSEAGRAWRTRVIYETNLRTSYAAGRWAQIQRVKDRRPYLMYRHSDAVVTPRPLHLSWDGKVIAADDPWWRTHFPPKGWGCKCRAFALSERDLRRMGKGGPDTPPDDGTYEWVDRKTGEIHTIPRGVDPGWDYAPGASRTDLARRAVELKLEAAPPALAAAARAAPKTQAQEFVRQALANSASHSMLISPVTIDTAIGVKLAGKWHALDDSSVRHTILKHGNAATEALRGHHPITADDLAISDRIFEAGEHAVGNPPRSKNGAVRVEVSNARLNGWMYGGVFEIRRRTVVPLSIWKRKE